MGQSTDAILVWGFDLGDPSDREDDKLAERIAYLNEDGYPAMSLAEKETGAELIQHCSNSCPQYIVGVEKTKTRAWRGHPKEISSLDLDVAEGQAALDAFAKFIGVESQPGRWILASDWS